MARLFIYQSSFISQLLDFIWLRFLFLMEWQFDDGRCSQEVSSGLILLKYCPFLRSYCGNALVCRIFSNFYWSQIVFRLFYYYADMKKEGVLDCIRNYYYFLLQSTNSGVALHKRMSWHKLDFTYVMRLRCWEKRKHLATHHNPRWLL